MENAAQSILSEQIIIHGATGGNQGRKPIDISTADLLDAIEGSYGNVTVICNRLGVSRNTALKNIAANEEAAQAFNDERHALVDAAEKATVELIKLGDASMVRFVLSSKFAENRGWGASASAINIGGANVYTGEKDERQQGQGGGLLVLSIDKIDEIERVLLGQAS